MNEHIYMPRLQRYSAFVFLLSAVLIHGLTAHFYKNDDRRYIKEEFRNVDTIKPNNSLEQAQLESFDPNTADVETLIRQGLSKYAANNLVNYRSTGWRAKSPEDLLNVYGVDSTTFKSIRGRIQLEKPEQTKRSNKSKVEGRKDDMRPKPSFDPNTASYQDLIDQGFSKYAANSLQGYLETGARIQSKEDLKRIYGIDENLYSEIRDRIAIVEFDKNTQKDNPNELKNEVEVLDDFDPNIASIDELVNQGFDRKAAYSLISYRKKGIIKKKEQLKRIYGMSDSLYTSIENRIQITIDSTVDTSEREYRDIEGSPIVAADTLIYNLNNVTPEELLGITGIGTYYSKAIVEYRKKLGGYYSVKQLLEVPAFKEEHFPKLEGRFIVDGNITRISPVAEFKELLRHPYIDYQLAKKFKTMSVFDMEERIQDMISTGQIEERLVPYIQKY